MARGADHAGNRAPGGNNPGKSVYSKHPDGTKWAYFKNMPPGVSNSGHGHWIRVGSPNWKKIQQINAGKGGPGTGGRGYQSNTYHPSRFTRSPWNPASPQYTKWRIAQGDAQRAAGAPPTATKPGAGKPPAAKPGAGGGGGGGGNGGNAAKNSYAKYLGSANNQQLESKKDAGAIAGEQFDSQIHDALAQQVEGQAQAKQNQADIANWLGAIKQQIDNGQTATNQVATQKENATGNAVNQILASIGGGANGQASQVGAAGINDLAAQQQLQQIQSDFANNEKSADTAQSAGQALAQAALDSQAQAAIATNIQDLKGQRQDAKVAAAQQILANNNAARLQNFNNRASKLDTVLGAVAAGVNINIAQDQDAGIKATNAANGAATVKPGGHASWKTMTPNDKYEFAQQLIQGPNNSTLAFSAVMKRAAALGYTPANMGPNYNGFANYIKSFL